MARPKITQPNAKRLNKAPGRFCATENLGRKNAAVWRLRTISPVKSRWGRGLEASGIRLRWEMADLPRLLWLETPQALQVAWIMRVLLTNVVKHAQATEVTHALAG